MVSAGIFGPKLSGKTTLAKRLSVDYWRKARLRSLVLDPFVSLWGPQAWVCKDSTQFWEVVWKTKGCVVIVDEAAMTIQRDAELVPVFTSLRHNQHRLIVIGHSGVNLLPMMREQFDTLYLFRQPERAAKVWAETFCQPELLKATTLGRFEFLFTQTYGTCRRLRLPPP